MILALMVDTYCPRVKELGLFKRVDDFVSQNGIKEAEVIPPNGFNYQFSWLLGLKPNVANKSFYYGHPAHSSSNIETNSKVGRQPELREYFSDRGFRKLGNLDPLQNEFENSCTTECTNILKFASAAQKKSYIRAWPNVATLTDLEFLISHPHDFDFCYLHLPDPDPIAHRFGVESIQFRDVCENIDKLLSKLLAEVNKSNGKFVVFGDHGSTDVVTRLDIGELPESLRLSKDVQYFLDTTYLRTWSTSESKLRAIGTEIVQSGLPLSEVSFDGIDGFFGHQYFVCKPGTVFGPDSFAYDWQMIGAHGYGSACKEDRSSLITNYHSTSCKSTEPMESIHTWLLEMLR